MYKILPVIFLLFLLTTGCAYIVNGKMVKVPVVTTPEGATITVNDKSYTSPATVLVPRGKGDFKLHIEKEGFQAVDILLTQSMDIAFAGNAFGFGPLGLAVDFITGYAYDIEPDIIESNLQGTKVSKNSDGGLHLVLVDINQLPTKVASRVRQNTKYKLKK